MGATDGDIRYDFGGIAAVVGEINGHVGALEAQKAELAGNVNQLLAAWDSTAADAYHASQLKFDQAHLELKEVLQLISSRVGEGNDRMQETNQRAAASWA